MSALPAPAADTPAPAPAQATPQLRTLLLTDLVDSTGTVERLGDGPSAELFRAHDRLVLDLQQRWRGRLIDRSDGLLLLFERAIDGLGFALDYHRGLRELGKAHGVPLQARAGLHVGEVLTWRNSAEAVAVGAKPLEVEGLAKPLAGRLLGLARPGQILLSATAEALAHRAARELGERGAQLAWKSHGRWRFKGVPEPLEVYEAGEPGLAPLQAPRPDAKAWRDIPFWRRPAALAAELALVAVVAIGIWFFTRPQPAIAFSERDWVVVADMRNLTGQPVLDESLQQAFRISLEQSRHVNVLSDLKARDTLARMQRPPGTALDREIASEIAVRDGARAVILPTVAEVGGRVRVSAEVIDPQSQTTVYAEYADGSGLGSVLASVDAVTAALRGRLGEEIKAIERDSEPLPQVTTSNLDALRAYALGVDALNQSRPDEALRLFTHALERDPGFALAMLGVARVHVGADEPAKAEPHIRRAMALGGRLTHRDRTYAEAWAATLGPVEPMLAKWRTMGRLYPDYYAAHMNFALWSALYANRYSDGIKGLEFAANARQNPHRGVYASTLALHQLADGKSREADRNIRLAKSLGTPLAVLPEVTLLAMQRRHVQAEEALAGRQASTHPVTEALSRMLDISVALDAARFDDVESRIEDAKKIAGGVSPSVRLLYEGVDLELALVEGRHEYLVGNARQLIVDAKAQAASAKGQARVDALFLQFLIGQLAARAGDPKVVAHALDVQGDEVDALGYPYLSRMYRLLLAERALMEGNPRDAIEIVGRKPDAAGLYQARVVLMNALIEAGEHEEALEHATWLATHRGRAFVEWNSFRAMQPLNVAESNIALLQAAELAKALGREKLSRRYRDQFLDAWPLEVLPAHLRRRVEALSA